MIAQVKYEPMPIDTVKVTSPKRRRRRPRRRYRDGSLAHRLQQMRGRRGAWYDWGGRVMYLVGRLDFGETDSVPRGRDLYYREISRGKFETTFNHNIVRLSAVDPHQEDDWHKFDVQNDGFEVHLGYVSGNFYYLTRAELKLFRRWDLWECRIRGEWFGFRRWFYYRALHSHVYLKKPFACNSTPARGSGGYDHWFCKLNKRHAGDHRANNYTWANNR